jgi:hypothetical protein
LSSSLNLLKASGLKSILNVFDANSVLNRNAPELTESSDIIFDISGIVASCAETSQGQKNMQTDSAAEIDNVARISGGSTSLISIFYFPVSGGGFIAP